MIPSRWRISKELGAFLFKKRRKLLSASRQLMGSRALRSIALFLAKRKAKRTLLSARAILKKIKDAEQ
jgi:hypothetical protein